MKTKYLIFISILLIVLTGLCTVSASENVNGVDMTLGDSNSESAIPVDNWADLKSYCESTNDQIVYLNGSFSIDSQIEIKNNVNIIGDANYYIGGTADSVNTYSSVPFLCNDALNVTFTNVNFQYTGGKNLMQFNGNGNYNLENCNFINVNSGSDRSVILSNSGLTNVVDSTFSGCNVQSGVIINNANLLVSNSVFENNVATLWAGAIHTNAYATTNIYDSTFRSNRAGWNGGALYDYGTLLIYNSTFDSNNCTTNNGGGAIGACKLGTSEPYLYVVNSTFINNINKCSQYDSLSTTSLGRGGAISFMDDGTLKVYDNTFINNDAVTGSAICAISQGSYGSPDVEIVGNNFTNHIGPRGSDVLVVSLSNSNYLVENNTYSNNNISVGKFRLDIDDNNGLVTVNVTLRLKHPEDYDSDIITKSGFDVYVDNVYNKTVYDTTFTLNFADSVNHNVKVVPLCLAGESRNKNINDANYNTIYVSTTGSDNNNGTSRDYAVRTISKAIELASGVDYIKILEGTYYERGLTVSNVTIEGEGNVILDGSASSANTFIVSASSIFKNLQFTGIASNSAISIISETGNDYLITVSNCSFYSNNVAGKLINAKDLNIEDSTIYDNVVQYAIYSTGNLIMDNCNVYDNALRTYTITSVYSVVYMANGTIFNSMFTNNKGRVGIVRISGNNVTIDKSKFIDNDVSYNSITCYGGAIYGTSADNINIISSIFYGNYAYSNGGAIYLTNSVTNLNITNSILIGNTATSYNYQIGRANNPTSNIFAINNWWGNTIDNPYTAPTFQSSSNVNASIWLIMNVTSNATSLSSGESALATFDLTYTNMLGGDASNESTIGGNLTPFCIDGVYLPILDGVLTATNGNVNVTNISLIEGKASVLFTASTNNPYLTISLLGITENIYFNNQELLLLNELNNPDSVHTSNQLFTFEKSSDDLLGYGLNPEEIDEDYNQYLMFDNYIAIYENCAVLLVKLFDMNMLQIFDDFQGSWLDLNDLEECLETMDFSRFIKDEGMIHLSILFYNSTLDNWESILEDSYALEIPCFEDFTGYAPNIYLFNFTRGLYKFSVEYSGMNITYKWLDDDENEHDAVFTYNPYSWEGEIDLNGEPFTSNIDNLNSIVSYENNAITINPIISISSNSVAEKFPPAVSYDEETGEVRDRFTVMEIYDSEYKIGESLPFEINGIWEMDDSYYSQDDFPVVKPVNITMTVTQGDKVVKNFNVSPGSTYSLEGLAAGEYNLTAVYDDPYYGYATKTVSITVNKNIWENTGADEGYSHYTDYFGPKNVEPLWNLSLPDNYFNLDDKFQSSVIDSNGNVYVVNGTKILVVNSDGDVIKTLTIESEGHTRFSRGLALYNNYLICSIFDEAMYGASVWDISNNYAHSCFPWGSMGPEFDYKSTTSEYPPVVADGKVYISSWHFYSDKNHIYEWTTNTHSNPFPKSTDAPSIDNQGYIYLNTESGLVILDPELNILDLSFGDAGQYGRPVIDDADNVYVFNSDRTKVYGINREAENPILWTTDIAGGACGVMAVDNNIETNALYIVGNNGILYKLNRANGEMSELYNLGTNASSILVDARGTIYLGGADGVLYAVTNEGKTLFKYDLGSPISKDLVLDNKGTIYVYSNYTLYALGGAPKLYSEITINVSDVEVNRNNTIVAILPEDAQGNVIFIIDDTITSENIKIIDGNATWSAPGLLSGPHTVKVTWDGDSEYFGSEATEEFNAYKVNSTIDLEDSINYVGKLTQLNITLPSDANGTVNVTFNRKTESVKIVNGTATFETAPLEAGNYTIDFSWDGDERYFGNSSYAYFTVIKNDAALTIAADPIREGEDLKVTVTVSDDESGVILISVGDINDFAQINDGKAEFTISSLAADTYDINATYLGDKKYYNTTETSQVTVSPKDETSISISPEVTVEDDKQYIEVTLPDDATGNVLVDVNGTVFYAEVNGGKVSVPVSGLEANTTYPVTITYSGDNNYSSATKEAEITTPAEEIVEPEDPELSLSVENTVVTVSINDNATGLVIVTVGDISFVQDVGELAPIDVSEYLTNGTYSVSVEYLGDENFLAASANDTVTVPEEPVVEPKDPELEATVDNTTVTVTVNKDATGGVIVDVDGTGYYAEIKDGQAIIEIKGLEAGQKYTATVTYTGDENFTEDETTVEINTPEEPVVEPKDPELKATAENTTVTVNVNKDATGGVIVDVDGTGYYAEIKDGQAIIDVKGLEAGQKYTATVTYTGDDNFTEDETTVKISVPKEEEIEPEDASMTVDSINSTITVELPSDATGYVLVDVDGKGYYAKVTDGKATIDVAGLDAGNYTATVTFTGDENYKANTSSVAVSIPEEDEPMPEPVTPEMTVKVTNTTIEVTLPSDASGNLLVDVDGKGYYAPVKDGKATVNVIGLDEGTYPATVTYTGDDKYTNTTGSASVTVPKEEDPTPESVDPKAEINVSDDAVNVELPKDATGYVLVDVDGKGYYAPVKDGKSTVELPELTAGNHTVTVTYTGDDKYKAATANKTVEVPEDVSEKTVMTEDLTKVEKGLGSFVANFTDAEGKALANTKVTFEINGGAYTRTTNANGQATLAVNLVPGTYTIKTTNPVTNESATNTIMVLPRFTEDSDLVKYFRNDSQYVLKVLDDDGNPAKAGEIITYNINGVFYNRTTNATGHVKLNINLPPDTYIITAEYKGCKVAHNVTVLPTLTGKDITKKYGQADAYEAKLVDGQGKAYADQKIEFNINGVFYQRTTNADGIAKLNINLQAGKYIITASYGQARISNTVTVTA